MFDPRFISKRKKEAKYVRRPLFNLTKWSMELVPEDLRKDLVLDVRDVVWGP